MAAGGDITEVTYNHPTFGQGVIYPKAGEDSTYNTGGFESADNDDGIDGGGTPIDTLNRTRAFFKVVAVNDMDVKTFETVKNLAGSPVPTTWTFTNANGHVYKITGKPVGALEANSNTSVFDLKVAGGVCAQIV